MVAWRVKEKLPVEMNGRRPPEEEVERNVMILDMSLHLLLIILYIEQKTHEAPTPFISSTPHKSIIHYYLNLITFFKKILTLILIYAPFTNNK